MTRSPRVLAALATVGVLVCIVGLAATLAGPAPARDVAFVGENSESEARCHGPALWNGERAWVACDWSYKDRALVELDPETARATVLYRWSLEDGNTPSLRVARPCADGQVFVIGETKQTTLVTRRGADIVAGRVDVAGDAVLGAECRGDGIDLFVREPAGYAVLRVVGDASERISTIAASDVPGEVVGAWSEGGAWHAIVNNSRALALLAGKLGAELARIGDSAPGQSACAIGEPGGWLGTGSPNCSFGPMVHHEDGAFRVTPMVSALRALVVHTPPARGFGMTLDDAEATRFRGLGALDFELSRRGEVHEAQRGADTPVEVAKASFSALAIGAFALPLSGDRVAVWGGLGSRLVILGPDLRRTDAPGMLDRVLRPVLHFRASSNSVVDRAFYGALLLATPAWLIAFAVLRRRSPRPRGLVTAAGAYVLLVLFGVWSFFRVLEWL